MIKVTRLNGVETIVNAEQIEYMEERPDTVINFVSGRKFLVKESTAQIIERTLDYFASINVKAAMKLKLDREER